MILNYSYFSIKASFLSSIIIKHCNYALQLPCHSRYYFCCFMGAYYFIFIIHWLLLGKISLNPLKTMYYYHYIFLFSLTCRWNLHYIYIYKENIAIVTNFEWVLNKNTCYKLPWVAITKSYKIKNIYIYI